MVRVGGIIVGAEGDGEDIAAAFVHALEEFRLLSALFPVGFHVDQAAILKAEAGNVDGIGVGMFGEAAAAGDVATGEAAIGFDPGEG